MALSVDVVKMRLREKPSLLAFFITILAFLHSHQLLSSNTEKIRKISRPMFIAQSREGEIYVLIYTHTYVLTCHGLSPVFPSRPTYLEKASTL
jgi:hypothetical protein